jgi:hypothetical protein
MLPREAKKGTGKTMAAKKKKKTSSKKTSSKKTSASAPKGLANSVKKLSTRVTHIEHYLKKASAA